jgi:hypothetical protein
MTGERFGIQRLPWNELDAYFDKIGGLNAEWQRASNVLDDDQKGGDDYFHHALGSPVVS